MSGEESKTRFYIFKCHNITCKEIIPVQFFLSHKNTSPGIFFVIPQNEGLNEGLASVDAKCPFCRKINHFRINESIKEISKQEFELSISLSDSKISQVNVIADDPHPIQQDFANQIIITN
jgi:hypothetical protein